MNRITITPAEYHSNLKFDPQALPNLAAAGPVSASVLCSARDPLNLLFGSTPKSTKAMEWGSLVDCIWLTPELFDTTYIVLPKDVPQKPTKAMLEAKKPGQDSLDRQTWWREWESKSAGKIAVKADKMSEAESAVSMLRQHKLASYIRESSETQLALVGNNPLGYPGQMKCLIDLFPTSGAFKGAVSDLKSTNDITERGMAATTWKFEYHLKMAVYSMLLDAADLGPINRQIIIWQRSKFPFDVHVREMAAIDITCGIQIAHQRFKTLMAIDPANIANLFDEELTTLEMASWQRESAPGAIEEEEDPTEEA